MLYKIFRFVFFLFDPERIHEMTVFLLSLSPVQSFLSLMCHYESPALKSEQFGLRFNNPVGMAAGFDKNGKAILGIQALGVGFLEVGTVTPEPQIGNKKPRLLRYKRDRAIVNWLGFNNDGVEAVVSRIRKAKPKLTIPLGLNIGKGKETPLEKAADDYEICIEKSYQDVDFYVVNISSPNTPRLRDLQGEDYLSHLLSRLQNKIRELSKNTGLAFRPLLVKLSPDLTDEELSQVIMACKKQRVSGIVATNTTIDYAVLPSHGVKMGGISGKPLQQKATDFLGRMKRLGALNLTIVGVGGIASPADAKEKLAAGASLIEVYTGLIYEGPLLIKKIKQSL